MAGPPTAPPGFDADGILAALPSPVLLVAASGAIRYVNPEAEHFFATSAPHLLEGTIRDIVH